MNVIYVTRAVCNSFQLFLNAKSEILAQAEGAVSGLQHVADRNAHHGALSGNILNDGGFLARCKIDTGACRIRQGKGFQDGRVFFFGEEFQLQARAADRGQVNIRICLIVSSLAKDNGEVFRRVSIRIAYVNGEKIVAFLVRIGFFASVGQGDEKLPGAELGKQLDNHFSRVYAGVVLLNRALVHGNSTLVHVAVGINAYLEMAVNHIRVERFLCESAIRLTQAGIGFRGENGGFRIVGHHLGVQDDGEGAGRVVQPGAVCFDGEEIGAVLLLVQGIDDAVAKCALRIQHKCGRDGEGGFALFILPDDFLCIGGQGRGQPLCLHTEAPGIGSCGRENGQIFLHAAAKDGIFHIQVRVNFAVDDGLGAVPVFGAATDALRALRRAVALGTAVHFTNVLPGKGGVLCRQGHTVALVAAPEVYAVIATATLIALLGLRKLPRDGKPRLRLLVKIVEGSAPHHRARKSSAATEFSQGALSCALVLLDGISADPEGDFSCSRRLQLCLLLYGEGQLFLCVHLFFPFV